MSFPLSTPIIHINWQDRGKHSLCSGCLNQSSQGLEVAPNWPYYSYWGAHFLVGCLMLLLGPLSLSEGSHQWQLLLFMRWSWSWRWNIVALGNSSSLHDGSSFLLCLPGLQVPCWSGHLGEWGNLGAICQPPFPAETCLHSPLEHNHCCLVVRGHPWLVVLLSLG